MTVWLIGGGSAGVSTGLGRTTAPVVAAAAAAALAVPVLLYPALAFGALATAVVVIVVALHPAAAAYLLVGATPLIAGVDRGSLPGVPLLSLLRPHEVLALLVAAALVGRGMSLAAAGRVPRLRPTVLDAAIILLAVTSSFIPLMWMAARGAPITQDDWLYALNIWKFYGLFLLIRASVRTEREVRTCLWVAMAAASVVAVIAVLQSLQLFGVPELLATFYAPYGDEHALQIRRGTTTLASSIATGDVMAFNLGIALAMLAMGTSHRRVVMGLAGLFVLGGLGSGQFSAAIALLIVVGAVGVVTGQLARKPAALLPVALVSSILLQPVIERRLTGFSSGRGLPPSWIGRLENVRENFWSKLFVDFNYVLGVRPAARVPVTDDWRSYAWIESGHTWLLWSGGVPLLLAFFVFLVVSMREMLHIARQRVDAVGVAAVASFGALSVVGVLMILDAHLILRGAADLLFSLLALALAVPATRRAPARREPSRAPTGGRDVPEVWPSHDRHHEVEAPGCRRGHSPGAVGPAASPLRLPYTRPSIASWRTP